MTTAKSSQGPGCFFYGCVTMVVLFFLLVVTGFFAVRYGVNWTVNQYTDSAPVKFSTNDLPPDAQAAFDARRKEFDTALSNGLAAVTLSLSGEEINSFILRDDSMKSVRDKLRVSIEKDRLKANVSLPLDDLNIGKLKGRFLNGAATLMVTLTNAHLSATIDSVEVKGKPLPESFLAKLRTKNLAADVFNDPQSQSSLDHLDSIEIKDGRLIIQTKAAPKEPAVKP